MSLTLPPEVLMAQALQLDDFHETWPVWDETVCPWDVPTLGGHGQPIAGWDPDSLIAQE